MKATLKILLFIGLFNVAFRSHAQQTPLNYYKAIGKFDLTKLWCADKLYFIDESTAKYGNFPEPLGFIGVNYQRFYIHFAKVTKDIADPFKYHVYGKTRVNNNICSFTGTLTITDAALYKESDDPKYKQGSVTCLVDFKEDSTTPYSGYIKGKMVSEFCLNKSNELFYDSINLGADGYDNNQAECTWTSYKTRQSKVCNWGDYRIPNSKALDCGAGEFIPVKKYLMNGWQNFAYNYDSAKYSEKKATIEENRKWWK